MDSYFKAAVSDLDKLLDEFEQSTDELENSKNANPHDSKHHSLSSQLDYQKPKVLRPKVQEKVSCTTSDELSLPTQTANVANLERLDSEQNEKNVTGLDLLSMVDGGSSDKNQSSCLGRYSIPVCDLVSDTGNLSHAKNNLECIQNLQPDDSQGNISLTGFDLASIPATATSLSADSSTDSGVPQQIDRDAALYSEECNTSEKQAEQVLTTIRPSQANVVDSGEVQEKTETWNNSEVFDQTEQVIDPALITQVSSTIHSSKDESTFEKLPCEPLEDQNSANNQMTQEGGGKLATSEENMIESLIANLPKMYQSNENSLILPKEENLNDSSLQTENVPGLDHIHSTAEKCCSPEQNTNTTLNMVSTPESSEDIQTSLSCLPLAVSICGSLVTNEDADERTAEGEGAAVLRDITKQTESHKNGLSEGELSERTEPSEQDENQNKMSQCCSGIHSFPDREKEGFDNIISECQPFQHPSVTTSSPSLTNTEKCNSVLSTDIEGRSLVDLAIEEIIGGDMLVSDAELDAFLSEHCRETEHSKPLKEDTDDGLLHSDVVNDNFIDTDKLNIGSNNLQAEMEFKKIETSTDNNYIVSNPESTLGILMEKSPQWKNLKCGKKNTVEKSKETAEHVSETGSEVSDQQMAHNGGARPKQLLNLPPKANFCSEFNSPNTLGNESQLLNSTVPNTSFSDAKICPNSSFRCNNTDTQSCLEDKGNSVLSMISEPVTAVEQAIVLGQKQPSWIPDSEAPNCMHCQAKFTFTRRRHHCRACGKVFCASCCNRKCKLQYLDKEARVCISCHESINKGVCPREQRRVWFADGILPNGEVADTTKLSSGLRRSSQEPYPVESPTNDTLCASEKMPKDETSVAGRTEILCCPTSVLPEEDTLPTKEEPELSHDFDSVITAVAELPTVVELAKHLSAMVNEANDAPVNSLDYRMLCGIENCVSKEVSLIPEGNVLPPLLLARGEKGKDSLVEEHPSQEQVTSLLEESNPLTFILNANLLVNVKILSYCSERCWYFSTNGLHGLGQAEIIILLLCLPNEDDVPKEIFKLFIKIYKDAMKGKFIGNLENITFTEGFLGSKEHGGILFVTPTFQKMDDLLLPKNPFLCGILIQKQEVPWAKVFPIRLMLRLGAEYGVYPTPLTSIRHRKPLFGEIGHTLMNLLVDLRNYQYTLLTIDHLFIHMEMGRSCIKIPLQRYNEVIKVMNTSNEHVISIGASFSSEADSHLVCVQNDEGVYQTQANSATGQPRKITGASFVVFNGSLKTSSGFLAKSSIVEDGIMVQITPETMNGLRQALREKKDFRITCGKVDSGDLREYVDVCWVEDKEKTNVSVISPIDGKSMEGVQSEKIIQEENFEMDEKHINCTEVEYQAGSGGQLLPQHYLNDLDSALIPVIHGGSSNTTNLPLEIELIFFITESLSI
ncbi:hypothetical protein JD844_008725 [Phrynosoma platyrhinos]|uniref:Zinc finger FYVE domain-containing protein n=1 Tax=Phrynosoma platyrhinos TaxID=52577 RepID=A0ABQ7TE85_PHRPL|nr:hypothetical protein JD844_008725 [Phrynosoma platyrhinos]